MKTKLIIIIVILTFIFNSYAFPRNIYKYQIVQSDAKELNKLGDAIGISGTGWPVSDEELENSISVYGINFLNIETVFKETIQNSGVTDSIFIRKYKVESIILSGNGLSGELPDLSFDKLVRFTVRNSNISGPIPNLDFPLCKFLSLKDNKLTGQIPDFNLPLLDELDLGDNNLSGELIRFTGLPSLKYFSVYRNKLTSINKSFGLPKVEEMNLMGNEFTGELPSFNCPFLKELGLGANDFSGEIPNDMNLPNCTKIVLSNNNLTGLLPNLTFPSLKWLDISENSLTGKIPELTGMPMLEYLFVNTNNFTSNDLTYHPTLKQFSAYDCNIAGNIPNFNFPMAETIDFAANDLSGEIPNFNCPNLSWLSFSKNNLTGNIPNFNFPEMKSLFLNQNNLTGNIPNFNMPKLEILNLYKNKLTGDIPNFDCPLLWSLDLANNNLSGTIPPFDLPSLRYLHLEYNNLSGKMPAFNFPDLREFIICDNNLEGKIPSLNLPLVKVINLSNNNLSGELQKWSMPSLTQINLSNNSLEGNFDNSGLPELTRLLLAENHISGLPHLKNNSPNLKIAIVSNCNLTFDDLEPNMDIYYMLYGEQGNIGHYKKNKGNQVVLYVKTGGTANHYQWTQKAANQYQFVDIAGATSDSVIVNYNKNTIYRCEVTNTLVPNLTLYTIETDDIPACLSFGNLTFCLDGGKWESKNKNELSTSGKIKINNILTFEGSMAIDTTTLSVKADGEFYISEIPIPGGITGKYSFCKGEYELKLLGEEGSITSFLDSKFNQLGQLFGVDLKLSKLELVGGRNATGIKMDCNIGVPGISGSCGSGGNTKTEFKLSGLEFSRTSGITLGGVVVNDLGLLLDGYCLKNLTLSYDTQKDILISGAQIALPFGEIGGGFKLEQGFLDSIAWHLEAAKPPFVLGTTTIGIKGFFGHISNITDPKIEIELGGIFSDIVSDNFYLINASGRTVWPSIFELKGEGKFMKPPLINKPYQMNGGVSVEYDHPMQMFKMKFDGKIGTDDEETWLLQGKGQLKLSTKYTTPKLAGEITGKMTLPKFDNKFPYNWLNSMFSFPVEANSQSTFIWGKSHLLYGDAIFKTATNGPFSLNYVVNLEKSYDDDDFLWFNSNIQTKSAKLKNGSISNKTTEDINIPQNTDFAVIGVTSKTSAPTSTLKNPSGTVYADSSIDDNITYSISTDGKEGFWTIKSPVPGNWNLILQSPANSDSIFLFTQQTPIDLSISISQTGKTVNISWDYSLFDNGDSITILLDNNNSGFDGVAVAEGKANTGSINFQLSDSLSLCSYNLFAQVITDNNLIQTYANETILNPKTILNAPEIIDANYNEDAKILTVNINNDNDLNAVGYIVDICDEMGNDSIYSIVNANINSFNLNMTNAKNKSIKMTSFDRNGLKGCPSDIKSITTAINENLLNIENENSIMFYPNPTTGKGVIKYNIKNESYCEIMIVDFYGRLINTSGNKIKLKGEYHQTWDFGELPNGMYFIILRTKDGITSTKCILSR